MSDAEGAERASERARDLQSHLHAALDSFVDRVLVPRVVVGKAVVGESPLDDLRLLAVKEAQRLQEEGLPDGHVQQQERD